MMIYKYIFIILLSLFFTGKIYSKPVPPGAGDGDVAANILFLIDSSDSMMAWIGEDGLEIVNGADYDSSGNLLFSQSAGSRGVLRYTSAGSLDDTFSEITNVPSSGCENLVDTTMNFSDQKVARNANVQYVST